MARPRRVAHIDPSMKLRHLTLAIVLALGAAGASPSRALADCPGSDQQDATAQCDDAMPSVDAPDSVSPGAPDMAVPMVDADGDPIPFVEETLAPPPGTTLAFDSHE